MAITITITMTIGVVGLRAVGGRGAGLRAAARFGGCAASAARSPPRPASCAACFRPFRARGVKTPALPRARWCVWVGGGALRLWCPRRVRGEGALRRLRPRRLLGRSLSPPGAAAQLRKRRGGAGAPWGAAGSAGVTLRRRCRRCSAPLRTTSRRPDGLPAPFGRAAKGKSSVPSAGTQNKPSAVRAPCRLDGCVAPPPGPPASADTRSWSAWP